MFPKLCFNTFYLQFKEHFDFALLSACKSLSLMPNAKIVYKLAVAQAFNDVFAQIGTTSDYLHFFSFVNALSNAAHTKGLERFIPHFINLHSDGFDLESWLKNVNVHLFEVLENANIVDDSDQTKQRGIYLHLTSTLLFLVNVESQRSISMKKPWQFTACRRFLKKCTEFQLYRDGDKQYSKCFKLLNDFLECIGTEVENGAFGESMNKFLNDTLM